MLTDTLEETLTFLIAGSETLIGEEVYLLGGKKLLKKKILRVADGTIRDRCVDRITSPARQRLAGGRGTLRPEPKDGITSPQPSNLQES